MIRRMEANRTNTCTQCGQAFNSVRYNADYCSPKCRKRRQRELERVGAALVAVMQYLDDLSLHKRHVGEAAAKLAVMKISKRSTSMLEYWN